MEKSYLLFLLVNCLLNYHYVLTDDDDYKDDCKFDTSLSAKSDMKEIIFNRNRKQYPRDYCVYWKIVASKYEIVEVQLPTDHSFLNSTCEDGFIKLLDNDSDLIPDFNKWPTDSKFATKESDLIIIYRPGRCKIDFTISYKSVTNLELTAKDKHDDDDDDDDTDDKDHKDKNKRTGAIVGAVVGSVFAILLIGIIVCVVIMCMKRRRAQGAPSREDNVSVHFWSKPSGYTAGVETCSTSSSVVPDSFDSQTGELSKKQHTAGATDHGICSHNRNVPPGFSYVSPPVPPPYSGPYSNPAIGQSHLGEELPPSYVDAVYSK